MTIQTSLLHNLDGSENKVWPTAEYEAMITSNVGRCPKSVGKARKARHRAAIAMLEEMEDIRGELGNIHSFLFILNQADPDREHMVQVHKYYLKLSNILQNEADNFLVYEETNTGIEAVDADIEGLAAVHDLAVTMYQAALFTRITRGLPYRPMNKPSL